MKIKFSFLALFLALFLSSANANVTENFDENLMINVSDIKNLFGISMDMNSENYIENIDTIFKKSKTYHRAYRFMHRSGLRVDNSLAIAPNDKEAELYNSEFTRGLLTGIKKKFSVKPPIDFNYKNVGKGHFYSLHSKQDIPVGNIAVIKKGQKVFHLLLIGVYFENPSQFVNSLESKIDNMFSYRPVYKESALRTKK